MTADEFLIYLFDDYIKSDAVVFVYKGRVTGRFTPFTERVNIKGFRLAFIIKPKKA